MKDKLFVIMHTYVSITIKPGICTEKVMGVHFDLMLTANRAEKESLLTGKYSI